MAPGVYVDRMKCITSEDSADDIYMVVFRGVPTEPFNSAVGVIGPGNFWDDFDDGEPWNQDIYLAKYFPDNVYVVMLAERDSDNDLKDNNNKHLSLWRSQLRVAWGTYLLGLKAGSFSSGIWPPTPQQRAAAAQVICNTMSGLAGVSFAWPVGDDDDIGKPQHLSIAAGQTPELLFKNTDGGNYRVRFKIQ